MANYGEDSMYDVEMGNALQGNDTYGEGNLPNYERSGPPKPIDPILPSSEMQGSQTWPIAPPQHDTGGWGQNMDINQIRSKLMPDQAPPEQDYSMAQQLMHLLKQKQGAFKDWFGENMPKLTKTTKGYYPDGTPAMMDGQHMTRTENMRLRSPFKYEPGSNALSFQNPLVGTGEYGGNMQWQSIMDHLDDNRFDYREWPEVWDEE